MAHWGNGGFKVSSKLLTSTMRLLHTQDLKFEDFFDAQIPKYVILSHRWDSADQELSYEDFIEGRKTTTSGYSKLEGLCRKARAMSYAWVWIDTCCIDKRNSAELSEAINSMYAWYKKSEICLAYLSDVSLDDKNWRQVFKNSPYFRRGWTLQELLAPRQVLFCDRRWTVIGEKRRPDITKLCQEVTKIPSAVLKGHCDIERISVACRMSWAAERETSRIEDRAYCLMGIFGINMPLLYGEREKAFIRLQLAIMDQTDDDSLFAWNDPLMAPSSLHGILAKRPNQFAKCGKIARISNTQPVDSQTAVVATQSKAWMVRAMEEISSNTLGSVYICPLRCFHASGAYLVLDSVPEKSVAAGGGSQCSIILRRQSIYEPFSRIQAGIETWKQPNDQHGNEKTEIRICARMSGPAAVFTDRAPNEHVSFREPTCKTGAVDVRSGSHSMGHYPSRLGAHEEHEAWETLFMYESNSKPHILLGEEDSAVSRVPQGPISALLREDELREDDTTQVDASNGYSSEESEELYRQHTNTFVELLPDGSSDAPNDVDFEELWKEFFGATDQNPQQSP